MKTMFLKNGMISSGSLRSGKWSTALHTLMVAAVLLLGLFSSRQMYAQDFEQPVSWNATSQSVEEGVYEIKLTAAMDGTWHIYDFGPDRKSVV